MHLFVRIPCIYSSGFGRLSSLRVSSVLFRHVDDHTFPVQKDFSEYTAIKLLYYLKLEQLWEKVPPEKTLKHMS